MNEITPNIPAPPEFGIPADPFRLSFDSLPAKTPRYRALDHGNGLAAMQEHLSGAYQYRVLKWVCNQTGLNWLPRQLAGEALTTSAFNARVPSFPFYLLLSRLRGEQVPRGFVRNGGVIPESYGIHSDGLSIESRRFSHFADVPLVMVYRQLRDQHILAAAGRPIALVVPRDRMPKGLVIHNDYTEGYWQTGYCSVHKDAAGARMYIQSFADLILSIQHNWRFDS